MGPALELLLLLFFGIAVVVGGVLFFTRPLWKRAVKIVVEQDRCEREVLEAQARERANEAECRRRAEEELQRTLKGEDVPGAAVRRPEARTRREANMPCEETQDETKQVMRKEAKREIMEDRNEETKPGQIQTGEHR